MGLSPDILAHRRDHNLVLLPTGKVLVVGGAGYPGGAAAYPKPQIWDPSTGKWGLELAEEPMVRNYHSTALLLIDGRVLSAGNQTTPGPLYERDRVGAYRGTIYEPPYLFKSDNTPAIRPVITSAPSTIAWGKPFTLCTPNTATITRVCLIRPGAPTHGFDMNQRYVLLTHTLASNPSRLLVNPPASPDSAPPGDYMLFITGSADGADVPSMGRWARLATTPGDDLCDPVAPATVTDLSGCYHYPFHNPPQPPERQISLAWTAPADDGTLGVSGRAKFYDIRYSYQAINTETQFNNATPVSAVPAPASVGTLQIYVFGDFSPNSVVYFRMKTIDDRGGWTNASPMSNQAVVYTSSDCAEGEGFYGGSGGGGSGGGGFRARPAADGNSAQAAGISFVENSLLNGARIGDRAIDSYRLAVPPTVDNGSYSVRIRAAGACAASLDAVRLLVVDHASDVRAYSTESGISVGSRVATMRVISDRGMDLTASLDGSEELTFSAGDRLTVEMGSDVSTSGSTEVLVLEARSLGNGAGTDTLGIAVQAADGSGAWNVVRRLHPRQSFDELAVEGVGSTVLLLFERSYGVRFVGRLIGIANAFDPQGAALLSAESSDTGEVTEVLATADNLNATLIGPDTLSLNFSVPPRPENTVRDYFLQIEAIPLALKSMLPSTPASATRPLPSQFALYQNQPNPFAASTTIRFDLAHPAAVRLEVFDIMGRRLAVLRDAWMPAGRHAVDWRRRDAKGTPLPPGTYLYRLTAGSFRAERKLVVLP